MSPVQDPVSSCLGTQSRPANGVSREISHPTLIPGTKCFLPNPTSSKEP